MSLCSLPVTSNLEIFFSDQSDSHKEECLLAISLKMTLEDGTCFVSHDLTAWGQDAFQAEDTLGGFRGCPPLADPETGQI